NGTRGARRSASACDVSNQSLKATLDVRPRAPPRCGSKTPRVRDVVPLVSHTPWASATLEAPPRQCLGACDDLVHADGILRAASDVEGGALNALAFALGEQQRLDQVVDVEQISHLVSVPVDGDRFALECPAHEVRNPPLVFGS